MTRDELHAAVAAAAIEALPQLIGDLASAQASALARLASPPRPPASLNLVPLSEEWAGAHGYRFETAQKLARAGRLRGAEPAPSSGKGRRRRWLVPATLEVR